jgi:putative transposase
LLEAVQKVCESGRMWRTQTPKKRHKPEETVAKFRQVDVMVSQGQSVADAVRAIGVTEVTYYRWRSEFGGLKSDQVKRLKDLEAENSRIRRAMADLTLDKQILKDDPLSRWWTPLLSSYGRWKVFDDEDETRFYPRVQTRGCRTFGEQRSTSCPAIGSHGRQAIDEPDGLLL